MVQGKRRALHKQRPNTPATTIIQSKYSVAEHCMGVPLSCFVKRIPTDLIPHGSNKPYELRAPNATLQLELLSNLLGLHTESRTNSPEPNIADVIFLSLDLEYAHKDTYDDAYQLGITTLDTRALTDLEKLSDPFKLIKTQHWYIDEPPRPDLFCVAQKIEREELRGVIYKAFHVPNALSKDSESPYRTIVFVGQGSMADLTILGKQFDLPVLSYPQVLDSVLDTHTLAKELSASKEGIPAGRKIPTVGDGMLKSHDFSDNSLAGILQKLSLPILKGCFHNAANDSTWTLQVLLSLAVIQRLNSAHSSPITTKHRQIVQALTLLVSTISLKVVEQDDDNFEKLCSISTGEAVRNLAFKKDNGIIPLPAKETLNSLSFDTQSFSNPRGRAYLLSLFKNGTLTLECLRQFDNLITPLTDARIVHATIRRNAQIQAVRTRENAMEANLIWQWVLKDFDFVGRREAAEREEALMKKQAEMKNKIKVERKKLAKQSKQGEKNELTEEKDKRQNAEDTKKETQELRPEENSKSPKQRKQAEDRTASLANRNAKKDTKDRKPAKAPKSKQVFKQAPTPQVTIKKTIEVSTIGGFWAELEVEAELPPKTTSLPSPAPKEEKEVIIVQAQPQPEQQIHPTETSATILPPPIVKPHTHRFASLRKAFSRRRQPSSIPKPISNSQQETSVPKLEEQVPERVEGLAVVSLLEAGDVADSLERRGLLRRVTGRWRVVLRKDGGVGVVRA